MNDEFSKLSISLTKKITKNEKKEGGIFFTPKRTILKNIELLKDYKDNINTILEPSCGSCEYILEINKIFENKEITGIENNKKIYDSIKKFSKDNIKIINENFIEFKGEDMYDLIIGNPPYFVMSKKEVNKEYYEYFDGRPNIFILFIIKSLSMLNKGGILSFVLPKNFLNSLYYNKTREHINKNYKILEIIECKDDYLETKQETIIMIIRNVEVEVEVDENDKYIIKINDYCIFGSIGNITDIKRIMKDCKHINDFGLKCEVGKVVWNEKKDKLTNDNSKTRLIYSSDIMDNKLVIKEYKNVDKKNYIKKRGDNKCRLIVNRGYGKGKYNFNYCMVNVEYDYVLENHVISVEGGDMLLYEKIIKSFEDERTKQFIENYFVNNAINTRELNYILPIFIS
jgi:type I restriction-modification system DNA methylase subunit